MKVPLSSCNFSVVVFWAPGRMAGFIGPLAGSCTYVINLSGQNLCTGYSPSFVFQKLWSICEIPEFTSATLPLGSCQLPREMSLCGEQATKYVFTYIRRVSA